MLRNKGFVDVEYFLRKILKKIFQKVLTSLNTYVILR